MRLAHSLRLAIVGLAVGCGDGAPAHPRYGDVVVELRSGDSDPDATFVGTDRIVATIEYGACLEQLYRDRDELRFTESEGRDAIEEWRDRLCDDDTLADPIACTVDAIEQVLDSGPPRSVVTYARRTGETGTELAVGPLPDGPSAQCRGGAVPEVAVGAGAVVGLDPDGSEIWRGGSEPPTEAVVDQAAPIVIYAARVLPP
ncbi:MAG TPA: hypothetical protein VFG69_10660 [Nannocystaceae bacterium]|nr:hypothetical protein [Nannocystaceae bacterium]